jgi:cytochrome oxidase Cu insertion factor (SCO1/SenC/PrrC family)
MQDSPQSNTPQGRTTRPPQRFGGMAWLAIFIAVGVIAFLAWSQFQRATTNTAQMLRDFGAVPMFRFTNEQGEQVTRSDWDGQVTVVNFVFTRCTGPCPLMTSRMVELQQALAKSRAQNVRLVTVSVDPEYDTPEVLRAYAESVRADPGRWSFYTGPRPAMEEFVVRGMLQPLAEEPDGMPAHSTRFVVVDPNGKIRGFRDGESSEAVNGLLLDIGAVMREFKLD